MYEAMRQRPGGSSKAAGASAAVLITALVGYALMSGLAQNIVATILPTTTVTVVDRKQTPPPPLDQMLPTSTDLPDAPSPPLPPLPTFQADMPAGELVIGPGRTDGSGDHGTGGGGGSGGAGPARLMPKLISADLPDYPPASRRARETGASHLEVCVNEKGRVTSASIATSSGFPRLDDAALTWVKRARFRPASVGGAPQAMCGHRIDYEWNLERLCVNEDARGKDDKLKPCPSKAG